MLPVAAVGLVALPLTAIRAAQDPPSAPDWSAGVTTETVSNLDGGLRQGTTHDTLLRAGLDLRLPALGNGLAGTLHASAIRAISGLPSGTLIGDAQTASNIAAEDATRIYSLWYEQPLTTRLTGGAGIIDLNQAFVVTPDADLFLNSSFGIMPAVSANAATSIFPQPGMGATLAWQSARGTTRLGLFQGRPSQRGRPLADGSMLVGEHAWRHVTLGAWRYRSRVDGVAYHTQGAYGIADGALASVAGFALKGFVQWGMATGHGRNAPRYVGLGMVMDGWPGRPHDRIGVGMARERLAHGSVPYETATELTYDLALGRWLHLQPDLQYIDHPGADARIDHATVFMLRVRAASD